MFVYEKPWWPEWENCNALYSTPYPGDIPYSQDAFSIPSSEQYPLYARITPSGSSTQAQEYGATVPPVRQDEGDINDVPRGIPYTDANEVFWKHNDAPRGSNLSEGLPASSFCGRLAPAVDNRTLHPSFPSDAPPLFINDDIFFALTNPSPSPPLSSQPFGYLSSCSESSPPSPPPDISTLIDSLGADLNTPTLLATPNLSALPGSCASDDPISLGSFVSSSGVVLKNESACSEEVDAQPLPSVREELVFELPPPPPPPLERSVVAYDTASMCRRSSRVGLRPPIKFLESPEVGPKDQLTTPSQGVSQCRGKDQTPCAPKARKRPRDDDDYEIATPSRKQPARSAARASGSVGGTEATKLPPEFRCGICARKYSRAADVLRHIASSHKKPTREEELRVTDPRFRLWCLGCGIGFSRIDARQRHERSCLGFSDRLEEVQCGRLEVCRWHVGVISVLYPRRPGPDIPRCAIPFYCEGVRPST